MRNFYNIFPAWAALLHDHLGQPGYGGLFLVSLLASSLLPLGSEWLLVLMLLKGYSPLATVLTATAGNYFGAVTTYGIGRWGGEWLIERVLHVSPRQRERACRWYRRYGALSLLFSWLPVIGDPLCLAGGMFRADPRLFTLLVITGKLGRYAVVAWLTLGAPL